jgi:cytochrome c oxidase subunit II
MVPRRRHGIGPTTIGAATLLVFLSACNFGMPPGGTSQGQDINGLYRLLFWTAIPVGGVVYGLILWSMVRYRRRRDDDGSLPKQTRYNVPVEIAYTVIPILIVSLLFVMTLRTEHRVDAVTRDPAVKVTAVGFRWQWRFAFPDAGFSVVGVGGSPTAGPMIELPTALPVQVTLQAADVIHAFFVPDFNFKRDAIPGVTNVFDITIPSPGVFRGECAELCGVGHADMTFYIKAVSPDEFRRWLASNQGKGLVESVSTG